MNESKKKKKYQEGELLHLKAKKDEKISIYMGYSRTTLSNFVEQNGHGTKGERDEIKTRQTGTTDWRGHKRHE